MGRILAVDPGTRRVGLALTDRLQLIASPLRSIEFTSEGKLVKDLLSLARAREVERVVIGLPIREDGTEGEGCQRARSLAARLREAGIQVTLWDERYSSREAENSLREMGFNRKQSIGRIDQVAAAIILEDYLRSVSSSTGPAAR
jgi:putative Holliday junction resolvase